jgi:hypothetical protein
VRDASGRECLLLYDEIFDARITMVVARQGRAWWPAWAAVPRLCCYNPGARLALVRDPLEARLGARARCTPWALAQGWVLRGRAPAGHRGWEEPEAMKLSH